MLDVHPPHQAAHTWKDFFIHIATIVVGLLIAIGLEQTVEGFHHRHQVADAREALRAERTANELQFALATRFFGTETIRFRTNLNLLLYLQKHPKAPPSQWPGIVNYHHFYPVFNDSAWTTIERSNITELMPQAEVREWDRLYKSLAIVTASYANRTQGIRQARTYMVADFDPSHLTPAQLEEEIALAKNVLTLQYRLGGDMRNLAKDYPSFSPAPTTDELDDIMHEPNLPEYRISYAGPAQTSPRPAPGSK